MTASIPTAEPTAARAGDTWAWRREDLTDYPASAWTLKYYFRNAAAYFDATAVADGDAHAVTVTKATTASRAAGWYDWIAVAESATERHEVGRGRLEVLPDYAAAAVLDGRTTARKLLDYVEAELLSRGSSNKLDLITSTLADRSLTRDRAGLIALRSQLKAEVAREENAERLRQGLAPRNRLHVRFGGV